MNAYHKIPPVVASRSTERALKQILNLLEEILPRDNAHSDRIDASIDDVEAFLKNIYRGV